MKRLLLVLGALVCGAALAGGLAAVILLSGQPRQPTPDGPALVVRTRLEPAAWEPYRFQLGSPVPLPRYNLPATIRLKPGTEANVRILLDFQDPANYYFFELTPKRVGFGRVETGLESPLGFSRRPELFSDRPNHLVLKRRYYTMEAVLNDTVVARAEDETFHGGKVGAGQIGDGATLKLGRAQPCEHIIFADDFMKGSEEGGSWAVESGSWQVVTLRNPSLASNAFYYAGAAAAAGVPAVALRGEWFWDNYRACVSVLSRGTADVGLLFYYRDKANCYLFRWNADRHPDGSRGRKQLVKRWHGKETVLAEVPGGYQPGVWYEMEVRVAGRRIQAFVDGHQVAEVRDPDLCFGRVGLYTTSTVPAQFDDVVVRGIRCFHDRFDQPHLGRWLPLGGKWEPDAKRRSLRAESGDLAKAVVGSRRWRDYSVSSVVHLPAAMLPAASVGLVARYLDEANYLAFSWSPASGSARLKATADGRPVAKEKTRVEPAELASPHALRLECHGPVATAFLDDRKLLSMYVPGLPEGRAGLLAADVQGAEFRAFRVDFPLDPEPVLTTHEVFSREHTMEIWSGAASDWHPAKERLDGEKVLARWHRANFPGDATIRAELRNPKAPWELRLVLSATSGESIASGYILHARMPASGTKPSLTITKGKGVLKTGQFDPKTPIHRVSFQRVGDHLVAYVNDLPALAARDPEPLVGWRAAYAADGLDLEARDVAVFSENVKVYTFSRAATDWRPGAGLWETTNRWECDPRWSFFSGTPPSDSPMALLWNKLSFEGDVSVEFAVGPKMVSARGGGSYRYARDFNVSICADGQDPTSGYSFVFGGWDDTRTAIVRRKKVFTTSSFLIPRSSSIHRKWFYIKAEKRGKTLNYWIDGVRVLTCTDPDPLRGTRVAIWSWDCPIMVARVRISASRIGPAEPPGTPSAKPPTQYPLP